MIRCHALVAFALLAAATSSALADVGIPPLPSYAQLRGSSSIPSYYSHLDFNLTSPSAFATAVGGYANPAVYQMMPGSEISYFFSDLDDTSLNRLDRWGLFTSLQGLGFGVVHNRFPGTDDAPALSVTDYRLALSWGDRRQTAGIALGWSQGDTDQLRRHTLIQVGTVRRFSKWVSLGVAGAFSTETDDQSGLADLAVRPLGDHRVTLFGDLELPKGVAIEDAPWSAGALVEPMAGIKFIGRYFEDESFALSLAYTFGANNVSMRSGHLRASAGPRFDKDDNRLYTNFGIRLGYAERNFLASYFQRDSAYLKMKLKGRVVHTRYKYLDSGITLHSILTAIEDARADDRVKGIVLNLSGLRVSYGNAWEIREALRECQAEGKRVVIFIDETGMSGYYLASVADRVVMDPEGFVIMSGFVMGRTYLTNMLEKLGIGFDEWRFFKYKSAAESLSRHEMSEADREQRQALVDGYYETMRADVAESRRISPATFDEWIDDQSIFYADDTVEMGLVDKLGRWDEVKELVEEMENEKKHYVGADLLERRHYRSRRWGEPPRIAIVYAIGGTQMDTGIKARQLERTFGQLEKDKRVKAVVFRVNSPGGDPMASDVAVSALKKCAEKKPVIVSQGDVAASGGYWISMYGDEILAQPTTVTGSIGVIGGWVWDDGLSEKIGLESDFVKRGAHADVFFNLRLPLIGAALAHRPLSAEERARVEDQILRMYDSFVGKVAEGRGLTEDRVREIAEGRVWTGEQGLEIGLVDRLGGMTAAIALARERAGLDADEEVVIEEYGTKGLINFASLRPRLVGALGALGFPRDETKEAAEFSVVDNYEWFYLEQMVRNNGRAVCILPPEYLPKASGPLGD